MDDKKMGGEVEQLPVNQADNPSCAAFGMVPFKRSIAMETGPVIPSHLRAFGNQAAICA